MDNKLNSEILIDLNTQINENNLKLDSLNKEMQNFIIEVVGKKLLFGDIIPICDSSNVYVFKRWSGNRLMVDLYSEYAHFHGWDTTTIECNDVYLVLDETDIILEFLEYDNLLPSYDNISNYKKIK